MIPCRGQMSLSATRFVLSFKTYRSSNLQPTPTTTKNYEVASKKPASESHGANNSARTNQQGPHNPHSKHDNKLHHHQHFSHHPSTTRPLRPSSRTPTANLQLRGHSYRQAPQTHHVQQGPEASQSLEASRLGHDGSRRGYQHYARISN